MADRGERQQGNFGLLCNHGEDLVGLACLGDKRELPHYVQRTLHKNRSQKGRNALLFRNDPSKPGGIVQSACNLWEQKQLAQCSLTQPSIETTEHRQVIGSWQAPPFAYIRLKCDAALRTGRGSVAVVVGDWNGIVICEHARLIDYICAADLLEALALREAVSVAR
ncbi:conserved hypothetical protein [Ricinus communis]|uniref:RNase H type-1 domain-containing protein n=1 Tax=Ricinus communis TaxID=3988 RepID=B9R8Y1_RICCO|nr:conserved hypothetical protein [Ricinus communis]